MKAPEKLCKSPLGPKEGLAPPTPLLRRIQKRRPFWPGSRNGAYRDAPY